MAVTTGQTYDIPEQYLGKSLENLGNQFQNPVSAQLLAQAFGIDYRSPFSKDQVLTYGQPGTREISSGSSEENLLRQIFGGGISQEQRAVRPAIQTLQAEKAPLQERYAKLLESIKARGQQEVQQSDINSARELGRRGITTDSTFAGQYQQQQRLPVQTQFGQLEAQTELTGQQAQTDLATTIAQLQAGAGSQQVQNALEMYRLQQQSRENQLNRDLQEKLNTPSTFDTSQFDGLWNKIFG